MSFEYIAYKSSCGRGFNLVLETKGELYQSGSCRRSDTTAGRVAACRDQEIDDDACRYGMGTGAFLLPVYGGGELPQAFCRVAAVAGATYVLRQGIRGFVVDEDTGLCSALMTESGQV